MRSVNKVILIGNLTRDPEMKQTQGGQAVVTFGIATNREWMTSGSERKKSTEFHEVVAWAKLAELCHKYLRKGKLVYLEGYLKTRSWEMEDGSGKRFRTEIVLQDMIMLEKRVGGSEESELVEEIPAPEETSAPALEIDDNNVF
ncbi:MAG: single-stranded DNA-binding protein [Candidatus Gracilibacteria bacterium]|jgi:single-strand DNA-binding protein